MAKGTLTGTRLRERRLSQGMRQAELARLAGISPAYLNLIEHNRRRVSPDLLAALAEGLGVGPEALAEGAESALFEGLREAAAGAGAGDNPPEVDRIEEFAGRFPGWSTLLAARQARIAVLERTVEILTERAAHDPYIAASLHEVLSSATAVRSTAAILAETEDIDPDWRARFHRNLNEDSLRLAEAAAALMSYLDSDAGAESGLSSPQEEVEAWLASSSYHIAALEHADPTEALITGVPELTTSAGRRLAMTYAQRYRAEARAMPLATMADAIASVGPDPAALAQRLGVGLPAMMRRMAVLPAGAGFPSVGLVIADAAGALVFRRPLAGFPLPRFGAGCPRWPLFETLARPMSPLKVTLSMSGRTPQRFVSYSICEPRGQVGFDGPPVLEAAMLLLPQPGLPQPEDRVVGSACRVCPVAGCLARRESTILSDGGTL